jgi:hypothetical protein
MKLSELPDPGCNSGVTDHDTHLRFHFMDDENFRLVLSAFRDYVRFTAYLAVGDHLLTFISSLGHRDTVTSIDGNLVTQNPTLFPPFNL